MINKIVKYANYTFGCFCKHRLSIFLFLVFFEKQENKSFTFYPTGGEKLKTPLPIITFSRTKDGCLHKIDIFLH